MDDAHKAVLHRYLRSAREAVVWKLEGLSEYDVRRPLVPTGTNLLGLVKHLANVEAGYFGATFGRPFPEPLAWDTEGTEDGDPNADLYASADETREQILGLYERACAHADATVEALDADAPGRVAWWAPERNEVTLHQVLVHVTAETNRHAGHADVVRELVDGAAGMRAGNTNLWAPADSWSAYRDRLEAIAMTFA